ncbi:ATP-dependent helicase [Bacillus paranthracis]|uniref:ATP-dependent helicase n=1 Tax=Bacillus paranthracis TaxID=2026186 RepID=UPI002D774189|nr:ATP-dependent helicase [Bacillus paranthracis]
MTMNFTDEQRDAINTIEGNVVTIASAGSGKTSAFTTRIANMIHSHNIDPLNILAFTFTKKASEEIQKRLAKMIGKEKAKKIAIGTFHGIAYRLLKVLDPSFEKIDICPDWWRLSTLNDICKPRTDKNHRGMGLPLKAGELAQFISYQKANNVTPNDTFVINEQVEFVDGIDEVHLREAYATYEQLKNESRQIDFDDMLVRFYEKLRDDEKFRSRIQGQFKYVLVDEFQDTSSIVMSVIKLINTKNVFVVGDFRQSIYAFINANLDNILNFGEEFSDAKLIELNKNFRSTQNIVNLSNDIIGHSPIEKYKNYKPSESVAEVGDKVRFSIYQDERVQATRIADKIEELCESGTPLSEIAILVRANAQTAIFEETLSDRDIPFDVSKSMSFFDRKEVLDLISYARLVANSEDDASFRRIINSPNRYLSKKFVEDLEKFAGAHDMNLMQAVRVTPQAGEWKFKRGIDNFTKVIQDLHYQSNVNAGRFLRNVVKLTRYIEYINESTISASSIPEKLDAVEKLCEMASKFPTIQAFLAHVSKIDDKKKKSKGKDAVNIMTVHASKGLEFDVVFVPNVNEELFPHRMNPDVEEERRLFYVACSRPRKQLFVSWFFYGSDMEKLNEGIFIKELLGKDKVLEMKKSLFRGATEVHEYYPS